MEHGNQFDYAQNVLGTHWLMFFWLALEEDEWRTLFTLDFSGRRTNDATQQEN